MNAGKLAEMLENWKERRWNTPHAAAAHKLCLLELEETIAASAAEPESAPMESCIICGWLRVPTPAPQPAPAAEQLTADEIVERCAKDCDAKCEEAEDRQDESRDGTSTDCTPDFKYGYESGTAE